MRFLSQIRIDEKTIKPPTEQLMADMGKLIEEMTKSGVLVTTAGLRPTSEGRPVHRRGRTVPPTDAPTSADDLRRAPPRRQAHHYRRPVHRSQGGDRRLRDPRGQVQGGGARAH